MQFFQTTFAVAVTLLSAGFTAQPMRAQAAAASKTAEEVYKNIVQLKGTPADQLMPAMQFMSSSLGWNVPSVTWPARWKWTRRGRRRPPAK